MLKGQTIVPAWRINKRPSRAMRLPKDEARCFGLGCADKAACKRHTELVYENNLPRGSFRGHVVAMSLSENGICRRKING